MKIWMYCTGLKHPAIYLQNNEFNRIDLFVSRALINSKYFARYSNNIFWFHLQSKFSKSEVGLLLSVNMKVENN